jgi:hypothetical protein
LICEANSSQWIPCPRHMGTVTSARSPTRIKVLPLKFKIKGPCQLGYIPDKGQDYKGYKNTEVKDDVAKQP